MSSSRQKEAPTSEPFPCHECGKSEMVSVVESFRLTDGPTIKRLRHYKCRSCGARLFDDAAMHRIQQEHTGHPMASR
jgi:hypothetical protein